MTPVRTLLRLLAAMLMFGLSSLASAEEPKPLQGVALVIGNGAYEHIAALANPANDARAIEALLNDLGFETTMSSDRDARRLKRDLDGFVEDANGADVAVIYYSGHGVEAGGENYLVPIDADLSALDSAGEKLVALSSIVATLKQSVPVTIVMLDACRSDPFPPGALVKRSPDAEGQPIGSGGLGEARGAVPIRSTSGSDENFGTVIGFAAEPGRVALDGTAGGNSPYAAAILRHLSAMDGAEFGTVMRMVAEEVYLKTSGKQRPWVNESLRRLLYFGDRVAEPKGEEGEILNERRSLLLTIANLPQAGRQQIEAIAATDGVPMDGLYAMLAALGVDAPKDPAALDGLMRAQAERLKSMMAERAALGSADEEIGRLSALADRAIGEGALETAIKVLGQAKARVASLDASVDDAEADIVRKRIEFAAVYARSAAAHGLAFEYLTAAGDYELAFQQVERWDDVLALTYKKAEAEALQSHGVLKGDNPALERAIVASRAALRIAEAFPDKTDWARAQNTLGNTLQALGDRQGGTELLEQSLAAYRAALDIIKPEDEPVIWAKAQNNLANTLVILATRSSDAGRLQEAVTAFAAAIVQFEKNGDKASWAATQSNGGKALLALGEIENSSDRMNQSGRAFEAALSVTLREREPLAWATMQLNLGNVFQAIGIRLSDPNVAAARHLQAVVAYRNALQEMTRERAPLQWATAQGNLANALQSLGFRQPERVQAIAYLRSAIEAHQSALLEITRASAPLQWATVMTGLGRTQALLADRLEDKAEMAATYALAAASYQAALTEMTRQRVPAQWASAQTELGRLYQLLSQGEQDAEKARGLLVAAETAQRAALREYEKAGSTAARAGQQHELGMTLMLLGPGEAGTLRYEQAEAVYREEMELRSRAQAPVDWARAQAGIANALRAIGLEKRDRAVLLQARQLTQEAWDVIKPFDRQYDEIIVGRLKEIDSALASLN